MNPHEIIAQVFEQLRGMWRFRWVALALAWIAAIGGTLFVYSMPDVYRASARVRVDTNALSRQVLRGLTASQDPLEAVQAVTRSILTRPNLESIANQTDLTIDAKSREEEERIVSDLQEDIRISGGADNIYSIQYVHPSREKSEEVVEAVYQMLVENATTRQGDDSASTEEALIEERDHLEAELKRKEEEFAKFRKDNVGFLPRETGDYVQRLQSAQTAVARTQAELSQLEEKVRSLRRQQGGLEPTVGLLTNSYGGGFACSHSSTIAALQGEIDTLLVRFKEDYPRVSMNRERIAELEGECEEERMDSGASEGAYSPPPSIVAQSDNPIMQNIGMQLADAEVEYNVKLQELSTQQALVDQLNRDVDKIVDVERQLEQMTRDNALYRTRYNEASLRLEEIRSTRRLEMITGQIQYHPIEPAFAPEEAAGPPRRAYLGLVSVFTLAGAVGVAFLLNLLAPAYFTRSSLSRAAGLPVLGSVSMVFSESEIARLRRDSILWLVGVAGLVALILIGIMIVTPASELVRSIF